MAATPDAGVVDRDCRVFGVPNLFVASASVFPTGGTANPTLTIVALSIRLAEHLRRMLSAGIDHRPDRHIGAHEILNAAAPDDPPPWIPERDDRRP